MKKIALMSLLIITTTINIAHAKSTANPPEVNCSIMSGCTVKEIATGTTLIYFSGHMPEGYTSVCEFTNLDASAIKAHVVNPDDPYLHTSIYSANPLVIDMNSGSPQPAYQMAAISLDNKSGHATPNVIIKCSSLTG